jgi:hypothetical protein
VNRDLVANYNSNQAWEQDYAYSDCEFIHSLCALRLKSPALRGLIAQRPVD